MEYISLKQQSEAIDGKEPMMQSEALGVVMIGHGEELGDSALGTLGCLPRHFYWRSLIMTFRRPVSNALRSCPMSDRDY